MMYGEAHEDQAREDDRQRHGVERAETRGDDREYENEGIEDGVLVLTDQVAGNPGRRRQQGELSRANQPAHRDESREVVCLKVVHEEQPRAYKPATGGCRRDEHTAQQSVAELCPRLRDASFCCSCLGSDIHDITVPQWLSAPSALHPHLPLVLRIASGTIAATQRRPGSADQLP